MALDMARLKARLRQSEGWRARMYVDPVGKRTIGYGHNLDAKPISPRAGEVILEDDVQDAIRDLDRVYPWWRQMNEVRQGVLADMSFNMGIVTLSTFVNTLAAMRRADYVGAARGMLNSKWAGQVGERAVALARMMRTGVYDAV